jgi:hypothetical protein
MRRLVVLVLMVSWANTSAVFAGETLRGVAERVVKKEIRVGQQSAVKSPARKNLAMAQEPPALSTSGIKKRTKFLIFLGAAAGAVATWYTIDHHVEDNTPSSLGLRED